MSGRVTQDAPPSRSSGPLGWPPAAAPGPGPGGRLPICSSGPAPAEVIPSTTTSVTSGAASSTAPLRASCTVTVEDGQPWQLPSSRSRATPSLGDAEVLHAARVRAQVRTHLVERPLDAGVHIQRVQVVQQQQALDQRVGQQPVQHLRARLALRAERGHDVPEPVAVQPSSSRTSSSAAWAVAGPPSDCRTPSSSSTRAPTWRASAIRWPGWQSSASAPSPGPSRCRGTCARRRAGKGRSCGRPA